MNDKKLCPVNGFKECLEKECAWYVIGKECCAVKRAGVKV